MLNWQKALASLKRGRSTDEKTDQSPIGALLSATPQEDFLASLWEGPALGCVSYRTLQPEVLVFGDSHAYSGIDYLAIARAFPGKKVGACAFPGGFVESFASLRAGIETVERKPEILFFLTSPRMFMAGTTKPGRIVEHQDLLFDESVGRTHVDRWVGEKKAGRPAFGRTAGALETIYQARKTEIESLDDRPIDQVVDSIRTGYLASWRSVAPKKVFTPGIEQMVDDIAGFAQKTGMKIFTAHIPESPFAEALPTDEQRAGYDALLDRLGWSGPAMKLRAAQLGIGSRYFLNRKMAAGFDYAPWRNGTPLASDVVTNIFDPDHLNLVGARKFTAIMLQKFGLSG